ncbi:oligosaccharide flippase family protein [Acinetobacter terrestris]|uniref:oligosaccharide flippase family protein n=1 Tax=Acinetobacter terrestris TaxID=2529843 RepID=UPI001BE4D81D|nr:oligosaccharide flippase family protein [Acinetobacter terrestris]
MKIIIDKRIFSNSVWMMLEKFLGIFGLIFVNSYMAKYIGPEDFGKLAFTTSIFVFVQTLSWFGAQNILFKHLSKKVISGIRLALATQMMRRIFYAVTSIIALTYLWLSTDTLTFIFGIGNCVASYFIVNDIYTIHNNSQLISIVNALTNTLGLVIALILRFVLVFYEADAYAMIFPIIIFAFIPYLLRKIYFYKKSNLIPIISNKKKYSKYLFSTGGSLVLSTLSIVLYTQISNIFLAKYVSFSDLAIYNVSLTLGGAWGFLNVALITSYFSKIYAIQDEVQESKYLKQIHWIVMGISTGVGVAVLLLGEWVIQQLYGVAYLESAKILPYIIIATMLSALGTISYRYMLKFNSYKYLSIKMLIVSLLSIPLSYTLIQFYSVLGAAICFVLIELFSLTIANYFFKNGCVLKMHLNIFSCLKYKD